MARLPHGFPGTLVRLQFPTKSSGQYPRGSPGTTDLTLEAKHMCLPILVKPETLREESPLIFL